MSQAPKPASSAKKPRIVTLTLRVPTLIGSLLALVVGLVWVFILGIMVGRGHAPETQIPQIAGLMPRVEASQVIPPQITEPQPAIPAEDLSYTTALRAEGARQRTPETPAARPQQRTPEQPGRPQPPAANRPETPPVTPPAPAKETFDYVYQVAAYKTAEPSNALADKLKKSGLKASTEKDTEKGVTWYKTMVAFRGSPDDVDTLRKNLAAHKLTRLILKTKKPTR